MAAEGEEMSDKERQGLTVAELRRIIEDVVSDEDKQIVLDAPGYEPRSWVIYEAYQAKGGALGLSIEEFTPPPLEVK